MRVKTSAILLTVLILFPFQSLMAAPKAELRKITDSVYSYEGIPFGTPKHAFSANAGIVIGSKAVLVVDTLTSAEEGEAFLADIRKITDKPIRYVVNTHSHMDHILGNSVFADTNVSIIGHAKCRDAQVKIDDTVLKNSAMFGLPEDFWKNTRMVPPTMAFEREMLLDLGNLEVKLIHSGMASHSPGSIVVWIPEQSVLFAGDILFTDFHPYLAEGDLAGWAKTIDLIRDMNVKYIIPGHGPLSTNKDLEAMKIYLTVFDQKARELSSKEKDIQKLKAAMLNVIPKRSGGDFIVDINLENRYLKSVHNGQD